MAVIRLANGGDLSVKLSVTDVMSALRVVAGGPDFVELPGEVIEDARRGTAGFRVAGA